VNQAHTGPVAIIDGRSCLMLTRLLATAVRQLGPGAQLEQLRPALTAIGQAADNQRALDADRLLQPRSSTDGFVSTKQYARAVGVTEQAIRKRLNNGTLAGEKRGRAWAVDPAPGPFVL
jgi:hypothetical protein